MVVGLLGWWSSERLVWVLAAVLWQFCGGFWLWVVPWVFLFFVFFVFFGGWGLRLWLVVAAVAVTVTVIVARGDELEKLRLWRF